MLARQKGREVRLRGSVLQATDIIHTSRCWTLPEKGQEPQRRMDLF